MDHIAQVMSRMDNVADELDVISHNLSTRINYDVDIDEALVQARNTQTYASGLKTFIVMFMCTVQTFFITQFFKSKQTGDIGFSDAPYKGLKAAASKNKDEKAEKLTELV